MVKLNLANKKNSLRFQRLFCRRDTSRLPNCVYMRRDESRLYKVQNYRVAKFTPSVVFFGISVFLHL